MKDSDYTENQIQKIISTIPKDFHLTLSQTLKIAS
jgi:hypothetical protein